VASDLSTETVRRVKQGEVWDTTKRLLVFLVEKAGWPTRDFIWIRASVWENGKFNTCSWHCRGEDEAVKWFNVYVELYGPPQRGEFLGFHYGNRNDRQVPETGTVPPMSCGS